jgi:hypothetical protein
MLVAGDQHADLVIGGEVHRADHPIPAALAEPALRGVQQRACSLGVVLALEPAEQAPSVVLELVEVLIDVGADATNRTAVAVGNEVLRLRVLEEWVLALVEAFLQVHHQRGDPLGLVAIQPPRQLDEDAQLAPGPDRSDLNSHCAETYMPTRCRAG